MQPSKFEEIRPRIELAVNDINYFLNGGNRDNAREEAGIVYDMMEAGWTPPKGLGKPVRPTNEQYMALRYGTKLRRRRCPDQPLDERRGEPLTDEEREAILAGLDVEEPQSDAGGNAPAFCARGGWLESSRQVAAWLRNAGETDAADRIGEALRPLFDEARIRPGSGWHEAMRASAECVKTILTTCLEEQAPANTSQPTAAKPSKTAGGGGAAETATVDEVLASRRQRIRLGEFNVVLLDGKAIAVKPNGFKLFELLLEALGEYVPITSHGLRTRDVESLPEKLRDVIESDPGAGTRIKREYLV